MLDTSTIVGTNIVTVGYSGGLGREQMERLRSQIAATIGQYGSVRLLVEVGDIEVGQIEVGAIWEDLKLLGKIGKIDRYAVLADRRWMGGLVEASAKVTPFDLRFFPADRYDEAVRWLND